MIAPAFLEAAHQSCAVGLQKENLDGMGQIRQQFFQFVKEVAAADVHHRSHLGYLSGLLAKLDELGQQLGRQVVHTVIAHILEGMHGHGFPGAGHARYDDDMH